MSEFLTRNIKVAISKLREATYSTPVTDPATGYLGTEMTGTSFLMPHLEMKDDLNKTGSGQEFLRTQRPDYWSMVAMGLTEEANTDNMALLLARCFAGTTVATAITGASGNFSHTLAIDNSANRQLPGTTLVTSVGYVDDTHKGASFIFPGCVVDSFQLAGDHANTPTFSAELMGPGGNYDQPASFFGALPDPVEQHYIHGASVNLVYNDGSSIDLGADQRLRSWTFTYNNNSRRDDRHPKDPLRAVNDPRSGAYVRRIYRGRRSCGLQATIALNEDLREFITHRDNVLLQAVQITLQGDKINSSNNHEIVITIPRAYVDVSAATDNDDAASQLTFKPAKTTGNEYVSATLKNSLSSLS